uniref:Uncharacterized protein n=1 Tax=Mycena chlorophos TaxID=658473 RepID=A0ABQ0KY67_MYCCL|nr:predicted protein [Mycena chlorophos]
MEIAQVPPSARVLRIAVESYKCGVLSPSLVALPSFVHPPLCSSPPLPAPASTPLSTPPVPGPPFRHGASSSLATLAPLLFRSLPPPLPPASMQRSANPTKACKLPSPLSSIYTQQRSSNRTKSDTTTAAE